MQPIVIFGNSQPMKSHKKNFSYLRIILLFSFIICLFRSGIAFSEMKSAGERNFYTYIDRLLMSQHVDREIIVKFKGGITDNDTLITHSQTGAAIKKKFQGRHELQLISLPGHMSVREGLEVYLQNPHIEYAEPNYIVYATIMPNDAYFNNLWGLHNTGQTGGTIDADIDAPEAWNITTGSNNVVIAVVDTGVDYNHPDLSSNIWTNMGETSCSDGIDNDGNGYIDDCHGWDFVGNDNDPMDYDGHGTHVAGTIAAVGNNSLGTAGVMWKAQIMPVRFLGVSGSGTTADAISAILYANAKGAHIINNSWGGGGYSQALKDAVDASNAVVVCAAGNAGTNNDSTPFYPASYTSSNIIAVAATDHNDNLATFSNYGATSVDVGAPGVNIYSTIPNLSYGTPITLYSQNFDSASGNLPLLGWNRGGTKSSWAVTSGTGIGGTNSLEDSPNKDYLTNTNSWAGYMTPITSVKDNLYTLSFKWKGVLENNYDYLDINYSPDGVTWDWIDYRTGSTNGNFISDSTTDITAAADMFDSFYFGFGLESDLSINYDGVYLDDVVLTRQPITISNHGYASYTGTSMATPHVSGLAGLIKALNPVLTNLEIKNAILNNVDTKSSLTGKVLTGGRINAYRALNSVPMPDVAVTPPSLDFGNINTGSSSDRIVTVRNDGTANLVISTVTSPVPPFSIAIDNCSGQTLIPTASCTITYRFSPASTGTFISNSNISSNDPDENPFQILLSGMGNALPISDPDGPYAGIEGRALTLDGSGSSDSDGSIVLYEWDVDNDETYDYSSSSPTQSHTYAQQGTYTIKLRITDNLGATDEATTTASISDTIPGAEFTGSPTSGTVPLTVNFTNNSMGYDQPLSYQWDFDNNGTIDSTAQSPSYIYANSGTYTVRLTVTDPDGSTNTLIRTDYITVTSSGCANPPVKIGSTYYSTLQEAYDAALDGDIIQSQDTTLIGDLNVNRNILITLEGGYDCNYTAIIGETRLNGNMTISNGTITVGNFILQ